MIFFFDLLGIVMAWVYNLFLFSVLRALLPMRKPLPLQILAFLLLSSISNIIIYMNDTVNILGVLLGFYLYVLLFFKGSIVPKISVVIIIYPLLVGLNYLCQDAGMMVWFTFFDDHVVNGGALSTAIHSFSFLPRLLLWFGVWRYCKKRMAGIHELLNNKMWLLLNSICAAVFVGLFVVLTFVPEVGTTRIVSYSVSLASIVTVLGCFYLVVYMANSIQAGYQLKTLQAQYQYYEDKLKDEERVRAVYHDMKNHLLVLQSANNGAEAQDMISAMQAQIASYENYYKTGNSFLDVILRDKAEKARAHGIDFAVMLHFEDGGFIDPLDISAIFGNALDNAIEACQKLPVSERLITVKSNRVHDMLSIVIENSVAGTAPTAELKTTKQDRLLHGFGLKNIEQAVAKYDGESTAKQSDGRFVLTILLPVP